MVSHPQGVRIQKWVCVVLFEDNVGVNSIRVSSVKPLKASTSGPQCREGRRSLRT